MKPEALLNSEEEPESAVCSHALLFIYKRAEKLLTVFSTFFTLQKCCGFDDHAETGAFRKRRIRETGFKKYCYRECRSFVNESQQKFCFHLRTLHYFTDNFLVSLQLSQIDVRFSFSFSKTEKFHIDVLHIKKILGYSSEFGFHSEFESFQQRETNK